MESERGLVKNVESPIFPSRLSVTEVLPCGYDGVGHPRKIY